MEPCVVFPSNEFAPERCPAVLQQTYQHMSTSGCGEKLTRLLQAYFATNKLIPVPTDALLSGHTFPRSESYSDLQVSWTLASFGLYKQAHSALRSALEQGLLAVYWNIDDDGPHRIRTWLRSRESTPFAGKVWSRIARHQNFQLFQASYNLRGDFDALGFLHDYVHTKGVLYSNALPFPDGGTMRVAAQRFSESAFSGWEQGLEKVLIFLALCYLVRYPLGSIRYDWSRKFGINVPAFGCLEITEVDGLEELVTRLAFRRLLPIAAQDRHAIEAMEWVSSLPDLTEGQIEAQLVESSRSLVRDLGLEKWLSFERACIARAEIQGQDTTAWRARLEQVKAWAELNAIDGKLPHN